MIRNGVKQCYRIALDTSKKYLTVAVALGDRATLIRGARTEWWSTTPVDNVPLSADEDRIAISVDAGRKGHAASRSVTYEIDPGAHVFAAFRGRGAGTISTGAKVRDRTAERRAGSSPSVCRGARFSPTRTTYGPWWSP